MGKQRELMVDIFLAGELVNGNQKQWEMILWMVEKSCTRQGNYWDSHETLHSLMRL